MNLSNKQRKLITSLRQKKYRVQHKLFVAEGIKVVEEFLASDFELHALYTTDTSLFSSYQPTPISEDELKRLSNLRSPNKVLALFGIREPKPVSNNKLIVALDNVNDPGNLGTIIRLCDWFGVQTLLCSADTVDCYNAKVVQASMGSLTRCSVHYVSLAETLRTLEMPVCVADMEGDTIYSAEIPDNAVIVMGNEANGISKEIAALAKQAVSIPRFGDLKKTESLNVATATAILLSECKRQSLTQKPD